MRLTALALAAALLAGCANTDNGSDPQPVNPYLTVALTQTVGAIQDVITLYGGLPPEAANTVVAARAYGDALCAVMVQTDLTPDERMIALQAALTQPRADLDAAYAAFGMAADKLEPAAFIAVRRSVSLARSVGDIALSEGRVNPEQFAAPCAALGRVPHLVGEAA